MPQDTTLLIDYEYFVYALKRRGYYVNGQQSSVDEHRLHLMELLKQVQGMMDLSRLEVSCAYANFNGNTDEPSVNFAGVPGVMRSQGITPVQVFNFSGKERISAAGVLMAMEAARQREKGIARFIIVSGAPDVVEIVLELKRLSAKVSIIGVEHSTSDELKRHSDSFEFFQEESVSTTTYESADIKHIGATLRAILKERGQMKFANVRPLLVQRLKYPLDLDRFHCANMGDFLRKYHHEMNVEIARGEADWYVSHRADDSATTTSVHTVEHYQELLTSEAPRLRLVDTHEWHAITDAIWQAIYHGQKPLLKDEIKSEVCNRLQLDDIVDVDDDIDNVLFQVFSSGAFRSALAPDQTGRFNWKQTRAVLAPNIENVTTMRLITRQYIASKVCERLHHRHPSEKALAVDPLCEMFLGPNGSEQERLQISHVAKTVNELAANSY